MFLLVVDYYLVALKLDDLILWNFTLERIFEAEYPLYFMNMSFIHVTASFEA